MEVEFEPAEPTLFPVETSLSPRLKWLTQHNLSTRRVNGQWRCTKKRKTFGEGETEIDATIDWALKNGVAHWRTL